MRTGNSLRVLRFRTNARYKFKYVSKFTVNQSLESKKLISMHIRHADDTGTFHCYVNVGINKLLSEVRLIQQSCVLPIT